MRPESWAQYRTYLLYEVKICRSCILSEVGIANFFGGPLIANPLIFSLNPLNANPLIFTHL
jgi:hypothetical protein